MIPALKVVAPGLHTTVQDLGRRGFQDVGVPVAGALDRIGLQLANALVGNALDAPALEILVQGPTFEVACESVRIALVGGSGGIEVSNEEARTVAVGRSVRLARGAIVKIRPLGDVACAYLALEGGVPVEPVLGSASTYARGTLGGFHGRPLAPGDVLSAMIETVGEREEVALGSGLEPGLGQPIRVVLGPQDDFFTPEALATFTSSDYTVSAQADRMGFRLEGAPLAHVGDYDIVSDAIVAGSIQVPGSRQPIVLLVDAQTTGGYPKIATVISADVPVLGRRRPGSKVRFVAVTQTQAEILRREQEAMLRQWVDDIRPVKRTSSINAAALYEENLVDGMVNAFD
jgi:biotin-dependent carboxylase-like uncharacterized protein